MNSSDGVARLPSEVLSAAGVRTGRVARVERFGGLSGRVVAGVHGTNGSVVVKGPSPAAEVEVARRLPELLARHGVRIPKVFCVLDTADAGTWIVMQYLPRPLPRDRWGADEQVIATLRSLHTIPPDTVDNLPERYRPKWDDSMTAGAAATLGTDDAVISRLTVLAERAQPLFDEQCVVSGDPNPLNWRVNDESDPILLDLERISLATPALDLAIALAGLPDRASAAAVISAYGAGAPTVDEVLLAKAWSVAELAAKAVHDSLAHDAIMQLRPALLPWLEQL